MTLAQVAYMCHPLIFPLLCDTAALTSHAGASCIFIPEALHIMLMGAAFRLRPHLHTGMVPAHDQHLLGFRDAHCTLLSILM